jgi:aminoglycoside phosphotransferase (APT) family kinase protein
MSLAVAAQFDLPTPPVAVRRHPGGHIHGAWQVTTVDGGLFLLQRLNTGVFPDPDAVMANTLAVTEHLRRRLADPAHRVLRFRPTHDGNWLHHEPDGSVWRLCDFIPGALGLTSPRTPADARMAGLVFGRFAAALADYPASELLTTLPGFHDGSLRLTALVGARVLDPVGRLAGCRDEVDRLQRLGWLATALPVDDLPVRVAHNDAKLANVLLDARTSEPVAVVDLDTVMAGTVLHDFGDLMRTLATRAPEDEVDLTRVTVDEDCFAELVRGYLRGCGGLLTEMEREHLVLAGLAITWEQATRFLADHLAGDAYYPVTRPDHNLDRARNQLRLLENLLAALKRLQELVSAAAI